MSLKRPAFTLLETMIALGVVVLAIASAAQINRVLLVATQESEDSVHATALAETGIHLVQLTQQYARNANGSPQTLAAYFGLTATARMIIPYGDAVSGNAQTFHWCVQGYGTAGTGNSGCLSIATSIKNNAIGDFITAGAETIGVYRKTVVSDPRLIADTLAPTTPILDPTNAPDWDFYTRTITITPQASFDGLSTGTYSITVTVTNQRTQLSVARTILLSDLKP